MQENASEHVRLGVIWLREIIGSFSERDTLKRITLGADFL